MLAQHHGKTAHAISARSAELAHRTLGGEHTVIATPKPSEAQEFCSWTAKRDILLHEDHLRYSSAIQIVTSYRMLAQHYAETAYALHA